MQTPKAFTAPINEKNSGYRFLHEKTNFIKDSNASFLKEKIMQISTALCYIDDDSFSMRTHIVHVIDIDNNGNLYFMLMQPILLDGNSNLKTFPLSLTFYKKAYDYYVQLKAIASVEDDGFAENGYILVYAKLIEANYVEHQKPFAKQTFFNSLKKTVTSLSKSLAMFFY